MLCLLASGCVRPHDIGGLGPRDGGGGDALLLDRSPVDLDQGLDGAGDDVLGDPCSGADCTDLVVLCEGPEDCSAQADRPVCDPVLRQCVPLALIELRIEPASPTLARDTLLPLAAIATYNSGASLDVAAEATWSSAAPEVASVDLTGELTAVAPGTSLVQARAFGLVAESEVTVTEAVLQSIEVDPATLSLAPGTSQQYTATGRFSDDTRQDLTTQVAWSSSSPNLASVSNSSPRPGLCRAMSEGEVTVRATLFALTGEASLTITGAALVSIRVTPNGGQASVGQSRQFRATGTFSDGGNRAITSQVIWAVDPPDIATVSNTPGSQGRVQAIVPGDAVVTASTGTLTGSATLTVR